MRRGVIVVCAILILCTVASPRKSHPVALPTQFAIGRHTFLDFGPPNNFYELFIVAGTGASASVERITLTPAVDACTLPPTVETVSSTLNQPVSELLGGMNPCAIPEKELRHELRRCKKCLTFSYADVSMQMQCGTHIRLIRSEILDRDMFDAKANTPTDTSWTMQLLSRLDEAIGPGVMNRPMYLFDDASRGSGVDLESSVSQDLAEGKYNGLFSNAPDKVSALYAAARKTVPRPIVRVVSVEPFTPERVVLPSYPKIAALAHVQGSVSFSFYVGTDGRPADLAFDTGSPLLQIRSVKEAINSWSFREKGSLQEVHVTMEFDLNCLAQPK